MFVKMADATAPETISVRMRRIKPPVRTWMLRQIARRTGPECHGVVASPTGAGQPAGSSRIDLRTYEFLRAAAEIYVVHLERQSKVLAFFRDTQFPGTDRCRLLDATPGYSTAVGPCSRLSRTFRHIANRDWAIPRERPRLRILSISVVRFTPRRAAAPDRPPTTQLLSSSAFRI